MANIWLILYNATSKFPYNPFIAAKNKFPKLWPFKAPSVNLYCITSFIVGSILAKASKQFLISPGGNIPKSSLSTPDPPPSSATVTIAVILRVLFFNPLKKTDWPVPPPITTTLGSVLSLSSIVIDFNLSSFAFLYTYIDVNKAIHPTIPMTINILVIFASILS